MIFQMEDLFRKICILIRNLIWCAIIAHLFFVYLYVIFNTLMIYLVLFIVIMEPLLRDRPRVHRPTRTVNGSYGPLTIPDSQNEEVCEIFMENQIQLCSLALGEGDRDRMLYHLANIIFVRSDPIGTLFVLFSTIPLAAFRCLLSHIKTINRQYYRFEEID